MMKRLMIFAAVALLPFQLGAVETSSEPVMLAYMKIPFAAQGPSAATPTFGLRVDHQTTSTDIDPLRFAALTGKLPLLDLQYRRGEMPKVMISGLNVIKYEYAGNAAEGAVVGAGVDWTMVAIGVGLGGMIIASQEDNDTKEDKCEVNGRGFSAAAFDPCADTRLTIIKQDCGCEYTMVE